MAQISEICPSSPRTQTKGLGSDAECRLAELSGSLDFSAPLPCTCKSRKAHQRQEGPGSAIRVGSRSAGWGLGTAPGSLWKPPPHRMLAARAPSRLQAPLQCTWEGPADYLGLSSAQLGARGDRSHPTLPGSGSDGGKQGVRWRAAWRRPKQRHR